METWRRHNYYCHFGNVNDTQALTRIFERRLYRNSVFLEQKFMTIRYMSNRWQYKWFSLGVKPFVKRAKYTKQKII